MKIMSKSANKIFLCFILFICVFFKSTPAFADSSLHDYCINAGGIFLVGQFINNYNIIDRQSENGPLINSVNLFYNNVWYEAHGPAVSMYISFIQFAVTLNRAVNLCVSSTSGSGIKSKKILGMGFTYDFG